MKRSGRNIIDNNGYIVPRFKGHLSFYEKMEKKKEVVQRKLSLKTRNQSILDMRTISNMTLQEIADYFKISRQRVMQILSKFK